MNSWEYDHFNRAVQRIEHLLLEIKKQGETQMAQIDDLNAKITALGTGLDNLGAALAKVATDAAKSFADLKAAIQAGATGTDLTTQLQAMDSNIAKLSALSDTVSQLDTDSLAADPAVVTPPPAV